MFEFNRYVPIAKVDEEQRMVYGFASTPDLDSDGEIIALDGLKKALPNYLQFPTLREMHQPKVAGTVKNAEIKNGTEKGLYIGAKVVADDAWNLVKEGVYRAFSIGGNVLTKVDNVITSLELVEISLVDVPANKNAKIDVWKANSIKKDAETAYSLSNAMITLKDTIIYFKNTNRPTKDLEKALELVKKALAVEAGESEKDSEQRWASMYDDIFLSENPEDIKKAIESLDRINFGDNNVAEFLRKAVKTNMDKKLKKNEEVETPVEEVTETTETLEEVTDAPVEEVAEETVETEETDEVEESTETEEPVETEEKADIPEFSKLSDVANRLEKLEKAEKPEATKVDYGAGFEKVSFVLEKMTDQMERLEKRITDLEAQPSALKSKKFIEVKKGEVVVEESAEATKIKARLSELSDLLEKLGPSEFAKNGYSQEAMKLQDELVKL